MPRSDEVAARCVRLRREAAAAGGAEVRGAQSVLVGTRDAAVGFDGTLGISAAGAVFATKPSYTRNALLHTSLLARPAMRGVYRPSAACPPAARGPSRDPSPRPVSHVCVASLRRAHA